MVIANLVANTIMATPMEIYLNPLIYPLVYTVLDALNVSDSGDKVSDHDDTQ